MVPGPPGVWVAGLHVPEAVVEEQGPSIECVVVPPRLMVVLTVRVITQNTNSVTLSHVSRYQVSQQSICRIISSCLTIYMYYIYLD